MLVDGVGAMDADVIIVGAGLAGVVAASEFEERGKTVLVVEQENAANLGGQTFWSFGGHLLGCTAAPYLVGFNQHPGNGARTKAIRLLCTDPRSWRGPG